MNSLYLLFQFFLQDTRSSNGTFINNQRLSPANEESTPREVCSGDIVQFGVDVMENSRKVTHGCIIATVKLYLPDGTEAKASRVTQSDESQFNASQMQNAFQSNNFCISSQELYELSQYLNEAIHREQILENKLETLQRVVTNAQESAHSGWKSLVEEDRLLSRIETLQSKLEVCLNSVANNKANNSGETSVNDIKEEMLKLIDDKEKYESAAKEAIQKALEEKLLVLTRLHEIETSIKSSEDECNRLQEVCGVSAKEINRLANCNDDLNKEIEELNKRLKAAEDQKTVLTEAAKVEKQALEEKIQELKTKETETSHIIIELKAINEAANISIEQLKLQLEVIKQEKQVISGVESSGDIMDNKIKLSEELIDVQKQLDLSKSRCNELSAQIDALKQQTISTTTLTDSTASQNVETNAVLTNGEIISTNDNKNSEAERVIIGVSAQSESQRVDQTTSQLNSEIDLLKGITFRIRNFFLHVLVLFGLYSCFTNQSFVSF
jgi:DNA repair exonuclease SbcCD ATPase subunit